MRHISERETELPDAVIGKMMKIATENKNIVSLGHGEPDFALPQPLIGYLKKISASSNHYTSPFGLKELREAVVKKVRKENKIKADIENVIITSGSQESLVLASAATMDATEQIIIPNPSFLAYMPMAEMLDIFPVSVPLREKNNFEFDPDELENAIDPKKTKAIIINTPANPTGNVFSKKNLEEIADIAVEHDLYIFSDEAYEKIVYEKKHVSPASLNGMQSRVLTFQSFSKSFAMCGFRVGYCIGPKDVIEAMGKMHMYTSISAPTISQKLAVKALSLPKKYTNSMLKEYKKRRDFIYKRLNQMNLHLKKPEGAFYAFANISQYSKNSMKFSQDLLKKAQVIVMPGSEFGKMGEGYIRCSYANNMKIIEKAMDRMEKFLLK